MRVRAFTARPSSSWALCRSFSTASRAGTPSAQPRSFAMPSAVSAQVPALLALHVEGRGGLAEVLQRPLQPLHAALARRGAAGGARCRTRGRGRRPPGLRPAWPARARAPPP